MGKVYKEEPIDELTIRKFERPMDEESFDSLIRKFCISVGLLQPGDSRDVIVSIFKILLDASRRREVLSTQDIFEKLKDKREKGIAKSNIRRHLGRLKDVGLVDKRNGYRVKEFSDLPTLLREVKNYKIEPTLDRIREYAREIEERL